MAREQVRNDEGAFHEPLFVEAGFQPAGQGGILPPGWEASLWSLDILEDET